MKTPGFNPFQSKKWFFTYFLAFVCIFLCQPGFTQVTSADSGPMPENDRATSNYPNILVITVDNVGYGDYALYNPDSKIQTPTLERMAREGAVLTSFYSAGATCTVSRAALLTGRIPQRNKLDYQLSGVSGNYGIGLRHSEILLPELIKKSRGNYATAAFGKWNIGFAPGSRPVDRGFDEYLGIASGNADHYTHVYAGQNDLHHNNEKVSRNGEYSTELFAHETIGFIEKRFEESRPWFIYLPFDAPHSPGERNLAPGEPHQFQAPDYAFENYDFMPSEKDPAKRYRAVVTAIDKSIGQILNVLDTLGIAENTFIFFYSDNGANLESLQERIMGNPFSSNAPLRGGRSTLYEGGIRVPALAMWKGTIPGGQVIDTRLWSPDIFTSCVILSEGMFSQDRFIDGKNFLPVLTGQTRISPHGVLYWEDGRDDALIWGDWKVVREKEEDPWQLYNIREDISEKTDRAKEKPELVSKLEGAFNQQKLEIQKYHDHWEEKPECNCQHHQNSE